MNKRLLLLVCVFLSAFILFGCGSSNKPFSQLDKSDQESFAWVMAENAVKNQLKAPSSAKFPSQSNATITKLGNNNYKVESYVDAQNDFGVSKRTYFSVTLNINDTYDETHKGYGYSSTCTIK